MENRYNVVSNTKNRFPGSWRAKKQSVWSTFLAWWYRLAAPSELLASANFAQREKVRHGRLAAIAVPIFILFLFLLQLQMFASHHPGPLLGLLVSLVPWSLVLFLNRKGFVKIAGVLALIVLYIGETASLFHYPGGLTLNSIYTLDFTIMSDLLGLAFFSANSLVVIFSLNIIEVWLVVIYAPHDIAITQMLNNTPLTIFSQIYTLQLFTALVLYIWARSAENALVRADRAEDIIAFERREKERRELELEQKRYLDAGIQQILQTHIAVANGDLRARAPLHQDHVLWQVAAALNNLISRLQSLSISERELRKQLHKKEQIHDSRG